MDISILDSIMVRCPNLVLLELPNLSTVNDEMIINLADHSPKLTHLDLSGCKQVGSDLSVLKIFVRNN